MTNEHESIDINTALANLSKALKEVFKFEYPPNSLSISHQELELITEAMNAKNEKSNKLREAQNKFHKHGKRW